jgi:hypothetical protein
VKTHEVSLIVDKMPPDAALEAVPGELLDSVGVVAFEDDDSDPIVHMVVEANSALLAIFEAVRSLEAVDSLGLRVVGVHSDDLVSLKDIAERTGRTYESVRLLSSGQRGPGVFPRPMSTGQWALYSWVEVGLWFAQHYGAEPPSDYDRQIAAADHVIKARSQLNGSADREVLAKLFAA